eukprot:3660262-Rhodomonas_salina.1
MARSGRVAPCSIGVHIERVGRQQQQHTLRQYRTAPSAFRGPNHAFSADTFVPEQSFLICGFTASLPNQRRENAVPVQNFPSRARTAQRERRQRLMSEAVSYTHLRAHETEADL